MNKEVMRKLGFTREMDRVERGLCPFCAKKIDIAEFRDALSLKEYWISGLCQKCQCKLFDEYCDDEMKIFYIGVTRARRKLVIVDDFFRTYKMEV